MPPTDATGSLCVGRSSAERVRAVAAWPYLVGTLVASVAFYLFARTFADPDLWGHLRFGQDLWATRQLIRPDPYSYLTSGVLWVNHEWLAELAFYLIYAGLGAAGLVAAKAAAGALVAGLGYGHLLRRGVRPALAGAVTVLALGLLRGELATVRPQLFSHLLAMLVLLIVYQAELGRLRWIWAAPPLFAIWANAHGGFLAGAGLVAVWAAAQAGQWLLGWVRGRRRPPLRSLVGPGLLVASLLATLANPYGVGLWTFLLRTATIARPEITEWQPLVLLSADGLLYLALAALSLAGLLQSRRQRRPALIALAACAAALPLSAQRHVGLFAIVALVTTGEHIGDAAERWLRLRPVAKPSGAPRAPSRLMVSTSLAASAAFLAMAVVTAARGIPIAASQGAPFPARAVALLRQSRVEGNLAVHFDWGEYVLWHLGPRIKVSVDGRRETVYTEPVYRQNLCFMSGVGEWDAVLRQGTDMALVSKAWAMYNLMKLEPGWELVYEDPLCALFARAGSPLAARIRATAVPDVPYDGAGLRFP